MKMSKLKERLSHLRVDNGKTKAELTAYLGITERTYNRYETGERQPDVDSLVKLAIFYGVTLDYLLGRDELEKPVIDRSEIVSYKDLVDMGFNGKLAHGLITEVVAKQPFEERIRFGNGKTKYAHKDGLKALLAELAEKVS